MPLLLAVSVLSAAVIAYEILLMRLFSIVLWYHFAYMIISLALLGFGASGTMLTLAQGWLRPRFAGVFATAAALFGVTAVAGFALARRVPFNPLEVVWDPNQLLYLSALYLVLAVPFFCAGTCIGLALTVLKDRVNLVYRYDLLGAGAGAAAVVAALFVFTPAFSLMLLSAVGFGAAGLSLWGRARRPAVALVLLAFAAPFAWPEGWVTPEPSPYKGLSQALRVPDARVVAERSSPLGLITVVESPTIPFRHAPGLSLNATGEPPPQLGVFTDGESLTAITRHDGDWARLDYLDYQSAALPYHLLDRPRVLVLGVGGGADLLLALYHGARAVDAVELNPQMAGLVRDDYADFAGRLFEAEGVTLHIAEARGFLARSADRYDLIQLALMDSFSASAAGVFALSESTLYTVEALMEFLARLEPGGLLAITRWLKLPPRDALKLFATAVEALERGGVSEPGERLALIRSWKTTTLVVKNGAFTAGETAAVRVFAEARSFDVAYLPAIEAAEANRYNVLDAAYFFDGARALLGPDRDRFLEDYGFEITPATDDRPYFFHFFKWRVLPEFLSLRERGGIALIEWGYLILLATLVQAAVASLLLILAPLVALARPAPRPDVAGSRGRVACYFLALGLAFLFIEIAFMQRFTLFLSHPLYAIAVVLASFLVFAGLGSGASARLAARWEQGSRPAPPAGPIPVAVAGIVAISLLYLVLLPPLFDALRPLPDAAKIAVSATLIAPLAFCMGMPFPLGLKRLAAGAPEWIPWAWAINGCASVLSAVLATLLAIHFGFTVVVGLAAALYGLAAVVFAGPLERRPQGVVNHG